MNYWKTLASALVLVVGLCAGAWAQDFYRLGFDEGMQIGSHDRQSNRAYQPRDYQAFKNGGSVSGEYNQQVYRQGFLAGYDRGFGRGDAYRHGHHDDDDRWAYREGYEYHIYGEHDRPPGWERGKKTGWDNCGMPPGQAKKYGDCRTYVYEGRPHYYYQDEQGRIVVRRQAPHPEGDPERHGDDKHKER